MKRKEFIAYLGTMVAIAASSIFTNACTSRRESKKMLMLGGRNFIGPSIIQTFLDAGWEVTLLNRGITNPHLFKELPIIICDREKENQQGLKSVVSEFKNQYWDCVVDTWQKSPKAVSDFIELYGDNFGHYHYVSTVSVYDDWNEVGIVESRPLNPVPPFPKTIGEEFRYAIRKTLSEITIADQLTNYTIYRSHGMRDFRTPDHTNPAEEDYWPIRFSKGGEILVPDAKDHYYQITDVQSLCKFILHTAQNKLYGAFNVAYPPIDYKKYVSSLINVCGKPKKMHWISGDFLQENGLRPYKDISAWKPSPTGSYHFDVNKALKAGLKNRPLEELFRDQIAGYKERYPDEDLNFGTTINGKPTGDFSMETEKEIIAKWIASTK